MVSAADKSIGFDPALSGFLLRPETTETAEISYRIYASTRRHEMTMWGWSPRQAEDFLGMQFQAQCSDFHQRYPDACFDLIEWQNQIIGRLIVDYRVTEILLVDIALLPEFRRRGLGSKLLQGLLAHAESRNLSVNLHVQNTNPALRLYRRLGFLAIEEQADTFYLAMRWYPAN